MKKLHGKFHKNIIIQYIEKFYGTFHRKEQNYLIRTKKFPSSVLIKKLQISKAVEIFSNLNQSIIP